MMFMRGVSPGRAFLALSICVVAVSLPWVLRGLQPVNRLRTAVRQGDLPAAAALLDARPELLNARDPESGATVLHLAVVAGQGEVVRALLAAGAEVNAVDAAGMTPLHKAAACNRPELIGLLIARGADPVRLGRKYRGILLTPLHLAAEAGFAEAVAELLANGADANALTSGDNKVAPLHLAAARNHVAAMTVLLKNGAWPDLQDVRGLTPADWARRTESQDALDLLGLYGSR